MFENKILISITIIILLALIAIIYYSYDPYTYTEEFEFINTKYDYDLKAGELLIAHASDDGTVKYYIVPTTTKLDYDFFKQKIDNHDYKFIKILDPEDETNRTFLNVIPKMDMITGLPEYVSKKSQEYELVYNLRYRPEKYKMIFSETIFNMAPYSIDRINDPEHKTGPIHDIFIQTSH